MNGCGVGEDDDHKHSCSAGTGSGGCSTSGTCSKESPATRDEKRAVGSWSRTAADAEPSSSSSGKPECFKCKERPAVVREIA